MIRLQKFLPGALLLAVCSLALSVLLPQCGLAQEGEFLTKDEVDAVRDAQEPEQRIPLFLEIAEIRLGAIRSALASVKSGAGRTAQKKMTEYTEVLEAMETAIADARTRRSPFPKAMVLLKQKLPAAKQFLESLDDESSALYADYRFTLDEAVDVTEEVIADIDKGMFPEVDERTAPTEFPSAPPRPEERRKPSTPAAGEESGPPRKPGGSSAPSQSPEDGPPRKRSPQ